MLADPLPKPWRSKGQNSTFSDHGHVTYQIKGYHESSNMVANILPADTPNPQGRGLVKIPFYSKQGHVAYQIKGNRKCSKIIANILLADTP